MKGRSTNSWRWQNGVPMIFPVTALSEPSCRKYYTEIPSLFVLFAILGGVSLIGPLGILIGPLVLSLLYSLISIYKKEIQD